MRKVIALFIISMIVLLVFAAGCAQKEPDKKLASRPVAAKPAGGPATAPVDDGEDVVVEQYEEEEATPVAGKAFCEQLSGADIAAVFGGTWAKTSDCPQRPQMPKGVDVCRCDYDGPKQLYVNVEAQLYTDADEAERVYNMYCSGTAEESEVGTKSCRVTRTDSLRPNYVHFLDGNYFVKVSCLGGSCPLDSVAELAKNVDAEI